MKTSVIIPTFNSSKTIVNTLKSVYQQTVQPFEILVMDDGSEDETLNILNGLREKITIFTGNHRGVSHARNMLCEKSKGELVAFLDSDDIWHPQYLATQIKIWKAHSKAAGVCIGHKNFYGYEDYDWEESYYTTNFDVEIIEPINFFSRYTAFPGEFQTMSGWTVPKSILRKIGNEPFQNDGAEDAYFRYLVMLYGKIVYCRSPMVAYRINREALSNNRLNVYRAQVNVFRQLEKIYFENKDPVLKNVFTEGYCITRRQYAKRLLSAGKETDAREQLKISFKEGKEIFSKIKSAILFLTSLMPKKIQPRWPSNFRV